MLNTKNLLLSGSVVAIGFLLVILAASSTLGTQSSQKVAPVEGKVQGASSDFIYTSGRDLKYKGNTVYLRGAHANNIDGLCSRTGSAGTWGSCNISGIHLREADYQKLSQLGGNHFRFGISYSWWRNDTSPGKTQYFSILDKHVQWAKQNNLWLVFNLFDTPGDCYEGYGQTCPFWNNSTERQQVKDMWVGIIQHYKNESTVAGYGLLNEPLPSGGIGTWVSYSNEIVAAMRAVSQNQLIMVAAGSDPAIPSNFNPGGYANIVYEIHDYVPFGVSHGSSPYPATLAEWCGTYLWNYETQDGKNGDPSCTNLGERLSFNAVHARGYPIYIGEFGANNASSGYIQYTIDKGKLYKDDYKISAAHHVWRGNASQWAIFPPCTNTDPNQACPLTPHNATYMNAVASGWVGAPRPGSSGPWGVCGDGVRQTPNAAGLSEVCDDGNNSNNDQCSGDCRNSCTAPNVWNGSSCAPPPAMCGDGVLQTPNASGVNEVCDDGNTSNNDQCSNDCRNKCTAPQVWNGTQCITATNQGLILDTPLTIDKINIGSGQTLTGIVKYRNTNSSPLTINNIVITARPPGGTNLNGPYYNFAPTSGSLTLQSNQVYTLTASLTTTSTDPTGQWYAFSTYNDASGWHDAPVDNNRNFTMGATITLPIGCKADYNANGTLDIADFQSFGQNYKVSGIACSLDIVGDDCMLTIADFQVFGQLYKVANACLM